MTVTIGQPVPDFTLRNQHGESVSLSSYRGAKRVVVVFYPFAFSSVCTGEMCELQGQLSTFENESVQLLALSCDPVYTLRAFADQEGLKFPLLSDFWPHGEVSAAYGAFNAELGCSMRSTFIVDLEGKLRWQVDNALPDARSLADYAQVLNTL
jgi:mycoredoxin-dependent peroxiredoxin